MWVSGGNVRMACTTCGTTSFSSLKNRLRCHSNVSTAMWISGGKIKTACTVCGTIPFSSLKSTQKPLCCSHGNTNLWWQYKETFHPFGNISFSSMPVNSCLFAGPTAAHVCGGNIRKACTPVEPSHSPWKTEVLLCCFYGNTCLWWQYQDGLHQL